MLYHSLGQTNAPQEDQGQCSGALQRAVVDGAWTPVPAPIQALAAAQIGLPKDCVAQKSVGEIGSSEIRTNEVSLAEICTAKAGADQISGGEVSAQEASAGEVGPI